MVYGAASDYRAASIVDAVGPDLTGGLELLMNNKLMAAEVLRRICPLANFGTPHSAWEACAYEQQCRQTDADRAEADIDGEALTYGERPALAILIAEVGSVGSAAEQQRGGDAERLFKA